MCKSTALLHIMLYTFKVICNGKEGYYKVNYFEHSLYNSLFLHEKQKPPEIVSLSENLPKTDKQCSDSWTKLLATAIKSNESVIVLWTCRRSKLFDCTCNIKF